MGPLSFTPQYYLYEQYHANFSIPLADQTKKWTEEKQGKDRQLSPQSKLWNWMKIWFWSWPTHLWAQTHSEPDRHWTEVKAPCKADKLPYSHTPQQQAAGCEITPGTQLPPTHLFVPHRQGIKSGRTLIQDTTAYTHPSLTCFQLTFFTLGVFRSPGYRMMCWQVNLL